MCIRDRGKKAEKAQEKPDPDADYVDEKDYGYEESDNQSPDEDDAEYLDEEDTNLSLIHIWCSFLNFFDSSIHFELSFMNMGTDAESFEKSVRIPFKKDEFKMCIRDR